MAGSLNSPYSYIQDKTCYSSQKVTDPLFSFQLFISSTDLLDSGLIHSTITDSLRVLKS